MITPKQNNAFRILKKSKQDKTQISDHVSLFRLIYTSNDCLKIHIKNVNCYCLLVDVGQSNPLNLIW